MILLALVAIPLFAAGLTLLSRRAAWGAGVTLAGTLATLGLALRAVTAVVAFPDHRLVAVPHWIALDPLGALILGLVAFVSVTAALFSAGYMRFDQTAGVRRYYCNFNLFVFSMLIVPLLQEPNLVWIAVELTTLFSVLLVGFTGTREALEAAWKYVVLTLMGAAVALLGFLLLYWAARQAGVGDYTWPALTAIAPNLSPVIMKAAFIFILVGFGAKAGLVPLHTWLPDAHSQAPAPVCALLSGVETTAVLYAILRVYPVVVRVPGVHAGTWLLAFGLLSVGTAAFLLVRVRDYKRLFAFSTVEHMGVILAAAGLGTAAAHAGAMLQIVGHAVTKSFCFYAAGGVLLLTGTRDIASVHRLVRRAPAAGAALLLGGLAIAGAPPFALFLSEFSILKAGLNQGAYGATGLLVFFIAIAFFAVMNHISRMVFGPGPAEGPAPARAALPAACRLTLVLAGVPVLVFGLYIPGLLKDLITLAAATMGG
jgi:hydrogenase-4 component F